MLELLANYYELVARITRGSKYLLTNENADKEYVDKYQALVNNVSILHSKIRQLKEEQELSMFNFNNIQQGSIHIENGFLVGNIVKGREEAYSLVCEFNHEKQISKKALESYELGLFALNLSSKVKESYIAPAAEINKLSQEKNNGEGPSEQPTLVNVEVETLEETKKAKEKRDHESKKGQGVMQFSMFSNS